MAKIISLYLTLFTILFLLFGCTYDKKYEVDFNNTFSLKKEYIIPDTVLPSEFILTCKYYDDSTLLFTDLYSKTFHKLNTGNYHYSTIGSLGAGPGEYESAFDFFIKDNLFYFNEKRGTRLQSIDLTSNDVKQYDINGNIVHTRLIEHNNIFYFLNWGYKSEYYIYNSEGKGYFKVPLVFFNNDAPSLPLNFFLHGNNIYFINKYENKIYNLNLTSLKQDSIVVPSIRGMYNWKEIYSRKKDKLFFENIDNNNTILNCFSICEIKGNTFFLISATQRKSIYKLYLVDTLGNVIFYTLPPKYYFLCSYKNTFLFYKISYDNKIVFAEFELNQNILNKHHAFN
jgi:hypothetical protein